MRSSRLLPFAALVAAACGSGSGSGSNNGGGSTDPNANVLPLSVNGVHCASSSGYANKPCVTVKVCSPGTSQCQTVNDVLLDTGSFGLRIFKQALGTVSLAQVTLPAGPVATCVQFGDQSSDWGPVQVADVVLGGEPTVQVPIHVIDATFGSLPPTCPGPETSPSVAGFNGILGVGVFQQDCGDGCTRVAQNGVYFTCGGVGTCTGTVLALAQQVQDPVALLPQDNNGVIVDLPAVDASGAPSVEGQLILGIGTRSNNAMPSATVFPVTADLGTFTTTLEGTPMDRSFLDTGSNGLFFAPPSMSVLPACAGSNSVWFCPAATVSYTATNTVTSGTGSPSVAVGFQIANFNMLAASSNSVFNDLGGGGIQGAGFDWGLPFHLGRRVATGFEGRTSPLGTGPLVAY
jgi:hypothetical protein